jgi:hypothetical protein
MAVLIPSLVRLRAEFNEVAPGRDTASDGWIGNAVHQGEVSDHNPDETGKVPIRDPDRVNEVHAVDVDDDLRQSDLTMEKVVQFLLARCRTGAETRLRYMIYNRRIWEAGNDWRLRAYTGPSAHTEHAHFSASYVSAREADTRSWKLEDIPMALTAADKSWISGEIKTQVRAIVAELTKPPQVPRWSNDGAHVPAADPVQSIPLADAAFFIGAGLRRVENLAGDILEAVAPDSTDSTS